MSAAALGRRLGAFVVGLALLAFGAGALADPPSRVARLGYTSGAVSFSPAGEDDWVRATVNRPLGTGDRLWSHERSRAEVQVGGAMVRMDAGTGLSILNLDDRITQLQLTQGTLSVRVRRLDRGEVFEVDTPHLALVLRRRGEYRIEVDLERDETIILMRDGQGDVYGENASFLIDSWQPYRFTGTDLRGRRSLPAPSLDEFDRWARDRDRAFDRSPSARYVSPDVLGYHDLDEHGSWRNDASYGNVWVPNRVDAGWAPYRDGHWAWIDPWGWTWVDDAPWGFAVSHYGRWANLRGVWAWVPGPVRSAATYAPALVVFVGGANFQLTLSSGNVDGVAWFPLAPREVYRPPYVVSRGYFERVNQSNTVIDNTVIHNVYNNIDVTQIVNVNRQVAGAVVAVPTSVFVQSQPVSTTAVRLPREAIASQPLAVAPPVAPTGRSVRGAGSPGDKPPARVFERPVIARSAPPPPKAAFEARQPKLATRPGRPLDAAERKAIEPAAAAPLRVKVLPPTPAPVAAAASRADRGRPEARPPVAARAPAAAAPRASTPAAPRLVPPKPVPPGDPPHRAAIPRDLPSREVPPKNVPHQDVPARAAPPRGAAPQGSGAAPAAPASRPQRRASPETALRAASRETDKPRADAKPPPAAKDRNPRQQDDDGRKPRD